MKETIFLDPDADAESWEKSHRKSSEQGTHLLHAKGSVDLIHQRMSATKGFTKRRRKVRRGVSITEVEDSYSGPRQRVSEGLIKN